MQNAHDIIVGDSDAFDGVCVARERDGLPELFRVCRFLEKIFSVRTHFVVKKVGWMSSMEMMMTKLVPVGRDNRNGFF